VQLSPAAARTFRKLPEQTKERLTAALRRLADDAAQPGRIAGKSVKTLRGTDGSFHRLRVGDHRVMYDVLEQERTILVFGIVHRGDLERWLRNR
jgi:mRNA interferase RelE/StbE